MVNVSLIIPGAQNPVALTPLPPAAIIFIRAVSLIALSIEPTIIVLELSKLAKLIVYPLLVEFLVTAVTHVDAPVTAGLQLALVQL